LPDELLGCVKKDDGKLRLCNGGKLAARDVLFDGSNRASSSSSEFSLTCSTEFDLRCRFSTFTSVVGNKDVGCGDEDEEENGELATKLTFVPVNVVLLLAVVWFFLIVFSDVSNGEDDDDEEDDEDEEDDGEDDEFNCAWLSKAAISIFIYKMDFYMNF